MAKIVIIGAGLTGLSTAYHLEKHGFYDYKIFEKESHIGGLCKSVYQDGFTFDYTGHLLHINDQYFHDFIQNTIGFEKLHTISRKSFIYSHDVYTPYPYQTNLYGLPTDVITDCIIGFIKRKIGGAHPTSYYKWVLKHFGSGLGKHFFFPYQQKIFSYDVRKLSSSWTNRFVPKTSLKTIISGAVEQNKETVGYNKQFFYPKQGGIFSWVKKVAEKIVNPIHTRFCVKMVDVKNKTVIFENGHVETYDTLISTMPLNLFLKCLKEKPGLSLKNSAQKLLCASVVNFNMGIFSQNKYDKHWVYYPEKQFPFYRIGFYHNFAAAIAPQGCSALYGEFSYVKKSKKYVADRLRESLKTAKKLLKIKKDDMLTQKIITIPHAYVIYDFWREKNIANIHKTLNSYEIHSIGRYGQWKYASMQESILDGKSIAEKLIFAKDKKYWHLIPEHNINIEKTR
ncbi:protoporphyrinogen/coproporphyrinogen oxidase [Candidatus Dependentiae bacterium]